LRGGRKKLFIRKRSKRSLKKKIAVNKKKRESIKTALLFSFCEKFSKNQKKKRVGF